VIDDAIKEWTKHGIRRDEMVAYTVHQQIDAFLDMAYASHQPNFQQQQFDRCAEEWTKSSINWAMIRYCYKRATE
jgi:hypothetical protein